MRETRKDRTKIKRNGTESKADGISVKNMKRKR